jgi:hypothetical protein
MEIHSEGRYINQCIETDRDIIRKDHILIYLNRFSSEIHSEGRYINQCIETEFFGDLSLSLIYFTIDKYGNKIVGENS